MCFVQYSTPWVYASVAWFLVITYELGQTNLKERVKREVEDLYIKQYADFILDSTKELEEAADEIVKRNHLFLQQQNIINSISELRQNQKDAVVNGIEDVLDFLEDYNKIADMATDFKDSQKEEVTNG